MKNMTCLCLIAAVLLAGVVVADAPAKARHKHHHRHPATGHAGVPV
jgi:hypothetical protein